MVGRGGPPLPNYRLFLFQLSFTCQLKHWFIRAMPRPWHAVHLGPDDNPLGLQVEIHLHNFLRRGYSKNLQVEICALRRQDACLPQFS